MGLREVSVCRTEFSASMRFITSMAASPNVEASSRFTTSAEKHSINAVRKYLTMGRLGLQCRHNTMADVLGAFEQAVLLAIVRLREDAYGRAILKEVKTRLERDVAAGAVHATLERLEKKGLV